MICILPQSQRREDSVLAIDDAIADATVRRLVVHRLRAKSIASNIWWRLRLRCYVAEQLFPVVYRAVGITNRVQAKRRLNPLLSRNTGVAYH